MQLGHSVEESEMEAFRWYLIGSKNGDAFSQNAVGILYEEGRFWLDKNDAQAVKYYKKAAEENDDGYAQINLGFMYQEGRGVPKDVKKGVALWAKAAEKGIPKALNNMGVCYQNGTGVEKDLEKASEVGGWGYHPSLQRADPPDLRKKKNARYR